MATTHTITEVAPGVTLFLFTALAASDAFDFNVPDADEVAFQVLSGSLSGTVVRMQGSMDGTAFSPLNVPYGLFAAAETTATNTAVIPCQRSRIYRLAMVGGTATNISVGVLIRRRVR